MDFNTAYVDITTAFAFHTPGTPSPHISGPTDLDIYNALSQGENAINGCCPCSQDIQDDLKAGVRSLAVRHQSQTRILLFAGVVAQLVLLIGTGGALHASGLYFLCTYVSVRT